MEGRRGGKVIFGDFNIGIGFGLGGRERIRDIDV